MCQFLKNDKVREIKYQCAFDKKNRLQYNINMGKLFKKKQKKVKKKLTQNQLVTRISSIIFAVMIIVMLIIVVPQGVENVKTSTLGQVEALGDLSMECDIDDVTSKTISDAELESLKTKLSDANVDIFDGKHIAESKFALLSTCENFTLTATELVCFANELFVVSPNYYSTTFYYAELTTTDSSTKLFCVGRLNFRLLCRFSDDQIKMYNSLDYSVPNKVYLSTMTLLSDPVSSNVIFNALDTQKSNRAKSFVNSVRSNFAVENVLYDTLVSALNTFCNKTNMTFVFENNQVVFKNIT